MVLNAVSQHLADLLQAHLISYFIGSFAIGYAISFLLTWGKKFGEKI